MGKRGRRKRDDFPLVNMNAGGGGDPSHLKKESEFYRERINKEHHACLLLVGILSNPLTIATL